MAGAYGSYHLKARHPQSGLFLMVTPSMYLLAAASCQLSAGHTLSSCQPSPPSLPPSLPALPRRPLVPPMAPGRGGAG
jgi:hypothetical protein